MYNIKKKKLTNDIFMENEEQGVGVDTKAICLHIADGHQSRFHLSKFMVVLKIDLFYVLGVAEFELSSETSTRKHLPNTVT